MRLFTSFRIPFRLTAFFPSKAPFFRNPLAIFLMFTAFFWLSSPTPAHASALFHIVETIRGIFALDDMKNTDWKGVEKDLENNLSGKKIMKALGAPDEKDRQRAANEPRPKVRIAQYLFLSLFFFVVVISGVFMLWMATRR